MPFFQMPKNLDVEIDFDKYMTVDVMSCTEQDGKIIPMLIRCEMPNQERITIKLDGVRSTKDILGGISFLCLATNYGRQQQVNLIFYYRQHVWVMPKKF